MAAADDSARKRKDDEETSDVSTLRGEALSGPTRHAEVFTWRSPTWPMRQVRNVRDWVKSGNLDRQEPRNLRLQQPHETLIHEFVLIRYI